MYLVIQVIICPMKNCDVSAKNEGMHAVNMQEVTSLADSYDSPLICANPEVSNISG